MNALDATDELEIRLTGMSLQPVVDWYYNTLSYAGDMYREYIETFGDEAQALFVGMNPGPHGCAQTGIPMTDPKHGLDIDISIHDIDKPFNEQKGRDINGWHNDREEATAKRWWRVIDDYYGDSTEFLEQHFVINYCPLVMFDRSGQNITPSDIDKSGADIKHQNRLFEACDNYLSDIYEAVEPSHVVGIGRFAQRRAESVLNIEVDYLMHPSPANPHANREEYWRGLAAVVFDEVEN